MAGTLNPKQRRFVDEYLQDSNATQAAIRAGYSERTANQIGPRLLVNVGISAEIAQRQAAMSENAGISAEWVLERLRENVDRSMTAEPVRDRDGNETGEYVYQGSVANRALELLGKHVGMFTDRHEVTGAGGGPLSVSVVHEIIDPVAG